MDCGVMVLSASGRLLFSNERARSLLASFAAPGPGEPARLLPQVMRILTTQSTHPRAHDDRSFAGPLPVEWPGNGLSIHLIVTRRERILLMEERRAQPHARTDSAETLEVFGITHREAEVLRWLAEGKSNPEIGIILAIATRTVKKHLEHIFPKLGVENRTTAAARALEVLRVVSSP
jgi:ATP/maltotriose-dependent transcriptional regulator MalT